MLPVKLHRVARAARLTLCRKAVEEPKETVETFKALFDVVAELVAAEAAVAEGTPSADALKRFRSWLEAGGGSVCSALQFASFPDAGIGMQATRDVAIGEQLFHVPHKRIMSEHTALADPGLERVAAQLALFRQFPSALLAFYLLLESQVRA